MTSLPTFQDTSTCSHSPRCFPYAFASFQARSHSYHEALAASWRYLHFNVHQSFYMLARSHCTFGNHCRHSGTGFHRSLDQSFQSFQHLFPLTEVANLGPACLASLLSFWAANVSTRMPTTLWPMSLQGACTDKSRRLSMQSRRVTHRWATYLLYRLECALLSSRT